MYIIALDFSTGRLIKSELHTSPVTDASARAFLSRLSGEVYGPSDVWPNGVQVVEVYQSRSQYGIGRKGGKSTNYGIR